MPTLVCLRSGICHAHPQLPREQTKVIGGWSAISDDAARADVAGAGEIPPQRDETKVRIEPHRPQLPRDKASLARRVDQEPAGHAAAVPALGVDEPRLRALAPVLDKTFRRDALENLNAGVARI